MGLHREGTPRGFIGRAPRKTHEDPPERAFAIMFEFFPWYGFAVSRIFTRFHAANLRDATPSQQRERLRSATDAISGSPVPSQPLVPYATKKNLTRNNRAKTYVRIYFLSALPVKMLITLKEIRPRPIA